MRFLVFCPSWVSFPLTDSEPRHLSELDICFCIEDTYRSRKPPTGDCEREILGDEAVASWEEMGRKRSLNRQSSIGGAKRRGTFESHEGKVSSSRHPSSISGSTRPGYWSISIYVHLLWPAKSSVKAGDSKFSDRAILVSRSRLGYFPWIRNRLDLLFSSWKRTIVLLLDKSINPNTL